MFVIYRIHLDPSLNYHSNVSQGQEIVGKESFQNLRVWEENGCREQQQRRDQIELTDRGRLPTQISSPLPYRKERGVSEDCGKFSVQLASAAELEGDNFQPIQRPSQ